MSGASGASMAENTIICKEAVTKLLKGSDFNMSGVLIVRNTVLCPGKEGNDFSKYKPERRPRLPGMCR